MCSLVVERSLFGDDPTDKRRPIPIARCTTFCSCLSMKETIEAYCNHLVTDPVLVEMNVMGIAQ